MSNLQLSLIILALIAIAGVWLFNTIVERRRTRLFERRLNPRPTKGQLDGDTASSFDASFDPSPAMPTMSRSEPTFADTQQAVSDDPSTIGARGEQNLAPTIVAPASDGPPAGHPLVDDEIHAVVTLEPETLLSGERAWSLLHAFRHAGRQPVMLVGVRGDLQEPIRAGQRYEAVLVAVQLANRSGPVNEIEWSEFVAALQHVCEQIPASCEVPDMRETTSRARALDAQCVPLDAQIGINLATLQSGWMGQHIADLAREHGLILRPDGRFHALDEHGVTLFVLQNGDGGAFRADMLETQQTARLTLLLDVPRAPQAQRPFDRLVTLANQLAVALDAAIVDDQSRPLTPASLASIATQIEPVYAKLSAAGMAAGSPRALALFG